MIEPHVFATGMALMTAALANAPREDDVNVSRAYYAILSRQLSGAQFEAAVQRVLATERFWPSPAVILAAAGCSAGGVAASERGRELSGAEAFARLLDLREYHATGYQIRYDVVERELGIAGVRALRAIGGPRRLADLSQQDATFARRDFARAFATASAAEDERALALTAGNMDARARELIAATSRSLPEIVPVGARLPAARGASA